MEVTIGRVTASIVGDMRSDAPCTEHLGGPDEKETLTVETPVGKLKWGAGRCPTRRGE